MNLKTYFIETVWYMFPNVRFVSVRWENIKQGVVANVGNPALGKLLQKDCQSSRPAGPTKFRPVGKDSNGAVSS